MIETARSRRTEKVGAALPLLLAALLAVAAFGTVGRAGCDDPGRYVDTPHGIVLVGGCLGPGDVDPLPGGDDTAAAKDPALRRG